MKIRGHEILLGFLLATAIWITILTLALNPTGYGEICEYTQAGQRECAPHHIILVALWKILKVLNDAGVAVTALATIAIAWFTWTLKQSTDKLWKAGERQAERELRAFVFVKAVGVTPHVENVYSSVSNMLVPRNRGWTVNLMWENGGGTRTKNLFIHVSHEFFDGEMPENFGFPDLGDPTRVLSLIGPKAQIFSSAFYFSPDQIRPVHAKTRHLYVWGWAEYDDIFENTHRHRTEFCSELFFTGDPFPDSTVFSQRMHRLHNAADEDCKYSLKTPRA